MAISAGLSLCGRTSGYNRAGIRAALGFRRATPNDGGRVFLAGDAAHQLPPTREGFGENTGIDDAYDLAWKLRMALAGEASEALLDTYTAEPQPVGRLRHQQTFARPDHRRWVGDALADEPLYGSDAMELGQRLSSGSGDREWRRPAASRASGCPGRAARRARATRLGR